MRRIPLFLMACILALVAVLGAVGVAGAAEFGDANATNDSTAVAADLAFETTSPAGVVLCRSGLFLPTAAVGENETIEMIPIPAGAMIVGIEVGAPLLSGVNFDIGYGTDPDLFFDGLSANGETMTDSVNGTRATNSTVASNNFIFTSADTIDVKVLGGSYTAGYELWMNVYYKMVGGVADEAAAFD